MINEIVIGVIMATVFLCLVEINSKYKIYKLRKEIDLLKFKSELNISLTQEASEQEKSFERNIEYLRNPSSFSGIPKKDRESMEQRLIQLEENQLNLDLLQQLRKTTGATLKTKLRDKESRLQKLLSI